MEWTFIICTHNPNQERVDFCIKTIEDLQIDNYEIIVIGGNRESKKTKNANITFLDFDENVRPGWTTKKKNLAAKAAKFENLCIMHDYFALDYNWYNGWLQFQQENHNWDIACNPIELINGARAWTDWLTLNDPKLGKATPIEYTDWSKISFQYVSGGYFCIKKTYFLNNPLSEELGSHEREDVEWAERLQKTWKLVCNKYSIVRHTKVHRDMSVWRKKLK